MGRGAWTCKPVSDFSQLVKKKKKRKRGRKRERGREKVKEREFYVFWEDCDFKPQIQMLLWFNL